MPVTVSVPGRIEVLGNHTDYNGGRVLVVPTRKAVRVCLVPQNSPSLEILSAAFPAGVQRRTGSLRRAAGSLAWANHVLGALRIGFREWPARGGLRIEISGDLPVGFGLASSAALCVGVLRAVARWSAKRISTPQVAAWAQQVENEFVGVPVGPLDPLSCAWGHRGWITRLDFAGVPGRDQAPMPPGWRILLFDTGVRRTLRTSAYARRREECAAAAAALGVPQLGSLSTAEFKRRARRLPEELRRRARHIVDESARVDAAMSILRSGRDFEAIGALLNDSQASSRENFENSHPSIDATIWRLRAIRGVAGARLTGGGFGGAVIAWVREGEVKRIVAAMADRGPGAARLLDIA